MLNISGNVVSIGKPIELDAVLQIFLLYVEPIVIAIGLIGNSLVVIVMPKQSVVAAKSAKFYYNLLAIANLLDITIGWLSTSFISQTLSLHTSDQLSIRTDTYNTFSCKIFYGLWTTFEVLADYVVVAMGIERIIAVW